MQPVEKSVLLTEEPFVPASQQLPEITFRGVVLAIILTIVLAAANAFLGLKVGLTVSASIPAAVISMGVLRFFRNSNILENNIVQTAASAGEALTAGVAFTLPALIVIHYWDHFNYWTSMLIAMTGGILGVLFSIPLRRVLLADKNLSFPEGTAIGKVLMASADKAVGLKELIAGSSIGAAISFCQTGLKMLADSLHTWFFKSSTVIGGGLGFAPALLGAGYIIGAAVAGSIFLGITLGWFLGVPIITHMFGVPEGMSASDVAHFMWKNHVRYVGLGTMIVGGIWAIFSLFKPMVRGMQASLDSVRVTKLHGVANIPRTERDMNIVSVLWCMLGLVIPIYFIFQHFVSQPVLNLPLFLQQGVAWTGVFMVFLLGFALAAICAYFAGLVGSSANPLSSMSLISLIIGSFVISLMLSGHIHLNAPNEQAIAAAGIAIIITSVVCCIAAISNDTIQDLKAGQMVGATPWKQQIMLVVGVIIAAMVIPLTLQLLFQAYGLSGVMPRPGMDPSQMLAAPQAGLMAAVVQGIFTHNVQWGMMLTGAVIAVLVLLIDYFFLRPIGWRMPVLAVGLGIYLPIDTTMPMVIGGILSWFVERSLQKNYAGKKELLAKAHQKGLLLASGLVAGSAVMGVVLAIPFVIAGTSNVLRIIPVEYELWTGLGSVLVTLALCVWIKRCICDVSE